MTFNPVEDYQPFMPNMGQQFEAGHPYKAVPPTIRSHVETNHDLHGMETLSMPDRHGLKGRACGPGSRPFA
jgi:hypothetical protein